MESVDCIRAVGFKVCFVKPLEVTFSTPTCCPYSASREFMEREKEYNTAPSPLAAQCFVGRRKREGRKSNWVEQVKASVSKSGGIGWLHQGIGEQIGWRQFA